MDKRTTGIILTIASVLLCGCPGISVCLFGALSAAGLGTWNVDLPGMSEGGQVPMATGIGLVCVGLIFIIIPLVVGFLTLRNKPAAPAGIQEPPAQ
ncbi:MAG: hypothetical protein JW726_10715 [Anaerolineales bacterium]|nr:hypothetical protein [Anaerolineales bacterium]